MKGLFTLCVRACMCACLCACACGCVHVRAYVRTCLRACVRVCAVGLIPADPSSNYACLEKKMESPFLPAVPYDPGEQGDPMHLEAPMESESIAIVRRMSLIQNTKIARWK